MLYKRALRKGKEVTTFLIKDKMIKLAWNLRIEPRPYQSEATEWALARGQAACSLPTSTGKTPVADPVLVGRAGVPERTGTQQLNLTQRYNLSQRSGIISAITVMGAELYTATEQHLGSIS